MTPAQVGKVTAIDQRRLSQVGKIDFAEDAGLKNIYAPRPELARA